ncbi:hypothetical protein P3T18_000412 [Paraburkholderia sp. GAS199]|uniref:hypothetical protein n=1 Tax=Paraburkholderia sp. GAS199 TaxID=3035126 RepID=UPI003D22EA52
MTDYASRLGDDPDMKIALHQRTGALERFCGWRCGPMPCKKGSKEFDAGARLKRIQHTTCSERLILEHDCPKIAHSQIAVRIGDEWNAPFFEHQPFPFVGAAILQIASGIRLERGPCRYCLARDLLYALAGLYEESSKRAEDVPSRQEGRSRFDRAKKEIGVQNEGDDWNLH